MSDPRAVAINRRLIESETKTDVLSPEDRESSMLNSKTWPVVTALYKKIVSHYGEEFKKAGGTDGVLNNLENYLKKKISELDEKLNLLPKPSEAKTKEKKENNTTTLTAGQIRDEQLNYKIALRALTDPGITILFKNEVNSNTVYKPKTYVLPISNSPSPFSTHNPTEIKSDVTYIDANKKTTTIQVSNIKHLKEALEEFTRAGAYPTAEKLLDIQLAIAEFDGTSHYASGWRSICHKGSNDQFTIDHRSVPINEIQAYYWLAANDPKMQFYTDTFEKEMCGREKAVEASRTVYVGMLVDIRRAHNAEINIPRRKKANETLDAYQKRRAALLTNLDNPSCIPGTVGRLMLRSSPYNTVSALPIEKSLYLTIPDQILNFIVDQLEKSDITTKKAIYNYFQNKFCLCQEIEPQDQQLYDQFLANAINHNNLYQFIERAIPNIRLNDTAKQAIRQMFSIEIRNLRGTEPGYYISEKVSIRILQIIGKSLILDGQNRRVQENLVSFQAALREISHKLKGLDRILEIDGINGLLSSRYLLDPKIQENIAYVRDSLEGEYLANLESIRTSLAENIKMTHISEWNEIAESTNIDFKADSNTLVEILSKHVLNFLTSIDGQIETIQKKLDGIEILISHQKQLNKQKEAKDLSAQIKTFQALLPPPPQQRAANYDSSPTSWAHNFLRLALEKEPDGVTLVSDIDEIQNAVVLMKAEFKDTPEKISETLRRINQYFNLESKSADSRELLRNIFTQRGLNLDEPGVKSKSIHFEDLTNKLVSSSDLKSENVVVLSKKSPISANWIHYIENIINNSPDINLNKISDFVLLTIFNHLKILQIRSEDAECIRLLCELYLKDNPDDQPLPYSPPTNTLESKIACLGNHIKELIGTLSKVKGLFNAGHINLLSSDAVYANLLESKEDSPCCLRVSIRDPAEIVLCWLFDEEGNKELYNYPLLRKDIDNPDQHQENNNDDCFQRKTPSSELQLKENFLDIMRSFFQKQGGVPEDDKILNIPLQFKTIIKGSVDFNYAHSERYLHAIQAEQAKLAQALDAIGYEKLLAPLSTVSQSMRYTVRNQLSFFSRTANLPTNNPLQTASLNNPDSPNLNS